MWYRLSYRNEISSNLVKMENEGKLKLVHCPFWLLSAGETEIIFPFSQKNQIFCIHKNQDSISLFQAHSKIMTLEVKGHWFGGAEVLKLRPQNIPLSTRTERLGTTLHQANYKPDKGVRYFVLQTFTNGFLRI